MLNKYFPDLEEVCWLLVNALVLLPQLPQGDEKWDRENSVVLHLLNLARLYFGFKSFLIRDLYIVVNIFKPNLAPFH